MAITRKTRSDAGTVKLTPRDLTLLQWVTDQYAVRVDQLSALMARPETTARQWMNRMRTAGFLQYRVILAGEPTWLWPTRAGLRTIQCPFTHWQPSPGVLAHIYAINQVRLLYRHFSEMDIGALWNSERSLRYEAEASRRANDGQGSIGHVADGAFFHSIEQTWTAIEVEISPKSAESTYRVIDLLLQRYNRVHYFVAPGARSAVMTAVEWIEQHQAETTGRAWPHAVATPVVVATVAELQQQVATYYSSSPPSSASVAGVRSHR